MKSENSSGRERAGNQTRGTQPALATAGARQRFSGRDLYALGFGLFLGLAMVKFGNPVILDQKIVPPATLSEAWNSAWPLHWAGWWLAPLALIGCWLIITARPGCPGPRWLWVLPAIWFGWQLLAAMQTVDRQLTTITLWHFAGCLACYFLGALLLGEKPRLHWLLVGVLAAFAFCLVRAVNQRLVEFPQERKMLLEGQHTGWTNFPPEVFAQMQRDQIIITTNGVEAANPVILEKYAKGRVMGTLVYPNALAGAVLLLLPVSLALAVNGTRRFRPTTRATAISLTLFLGGAGLFWSGSKSGWLIVLVLGGIWLFRLRWPARWKFTLLVAVVAIGLAAFAIRFHGYFASGATSVSARFDYWRAAAQITREFPWLGSGPGTFQHPYAKLKAPEAEMARLTHNDFLEQFCDSGIIGGLSYAIWIGLLLAMIGRRVWNRGEPLLFAGFLGLLGWFAQGLGEFSLYIPALAWTAFTLGGCLLRASANPIQRQLSHAGPGT